MRGTLTSSMPPAARTASSWRLAPGALPALVALALAACGTDAPSTPPLPACVAPASDGLVLALEATGGHAFGGFGAISSAGNDRYLFDYPEPQRTEMLDLLFTPGVGAALQILKAEMGGHGNSTDGSEASHMPARGEVDCDASCQFGVMNEARTRNPGVRLAGLPWSAPGWIGDGRWWSDDAIDYNLAWIDCAVQQGLTIEYMGGRNESGYDRDWFVAFRKALRARYPDVQLIGADAIEPVLWDFALAMVDDPELADSVDVVGVHYPGDPPPEVAALGKPLWVSEGNGGDGTARHLNRRFVDGRYTGFMNWPLITACSDQVAYGGGGGLLEAREPWSGHYVVRPHLWEMAHTTQFTDPGWTVLEGASGLLEQASDQGSYVTYLSPDGADLTLVIETQNATAVRDVTFVPGAGLPLGPLRVWRTILASTDDADRLVADCQVEPVDGRLHVTLPPGQVLTLTTLTRGGHRPTTPPPSAPFPLPYANDFEADAPGREGRFVASQQGAFVVAPCSGGRDGRCLEQQGPQAPIPWLARVASPFALLGDTSLADVVVATDFLLDGPGGVALHGRFRNQSNVLPLWHDGYVLQVTSAGTWSLLRAHDKATAVLAKGTCAPVVPGTWHTLEFTLKGASLEGRLDGELLGQATDDTFTSGLVGVGCGDGTKDSGWSRNQFDTLSVRAAP